jgi:hypothetical protein
MPLLSPTTSSFKLLVEPGTCVITQSTLKAKTESVLEAVVRSIQGVLLYRTISCLVPTWTYLHMHALSKVAAANYE